MNKSTVRILVVDDDPFVLQVMRNMLEKSGFNSIATCETGASALDSLDTQDEKSNLILLDLNMPEMDGIEFVRKLVEHNYAGSLILISGENERTLEMTEKLVNAHNINILGHLQKPVWPDELATLIAKWQPVEDERYVAKAYTASELRTGITRGELVNYYQPKVAVDTGAVVGVETLVRWRHGEDGLVFPDQFIDLAERNGLIDFLTSVVIVDALNQAKAWRKQGLDLCVAINVSMDNLNSVSFADFVTDATLEAGLSNPEIILEITESRLMRDQRAPLEVLARLRLKRFSLSIDDFGTGHSSLKQLHDIPFDELKIDRSFVHGAWNDPTSRAMYDASLGLGQQLGMKVIAEGVEDRHDWDMVRNSGCDLAQGYFIARPMPAAEIAGWIQEWEGHWQKLQGIVL